MTSEKVDLKEKVKTGVVLMLTEEQMRWLVGLMANTKIQFGDTDNFRIGTEIINELKKGIDKFKEKK